jgi:hypothetical protein
MAQSGFTPIVLYASGTATNTPSSGNLANGELAINYADGKLFYKDSSGVVQVLATKGGVNATSSGQVLFNNSGVVGGSNNLFWDSANTRLGIGTASPAIKLDIFSTSATVPQINVVNASTTDGAGITFGDSYQDAAIKTIPASSTTSLGFFVASKTTERMRIDSSGNVGIGTNSPSTYVSNNGLAIVGAFGTTGNAVTIYNNSSASASNIARINFKFNNTFSNNSNAASIYGINPNALGNNGGALVFATSANGTDTTPTERMRIDSTGNVGIGTNSPSQNLTIYNASQPVVRLQNSTTGVTSTAGYSLEIGGNDGYLWNYQNGASIFATNNTERMRIDSSGNLLVGCTGLPAINVKGAALANYSNQGRLAVGTTISSADLAYFYSSTALAGAISVSGSVCTYVSLSDYRLKENIAPMVGALDVVAKLKPVTYTWKTDGVDSQGFIAHELQEVVPECVVGVKDEVDAEGNPKYQGVDTSFLVATLTAAIQEQQAMITNLSAQVTALQLQIDTMQ